jgi:hypothetical protein
MGGNKSGSMETPGRKRADKKINGYTLLRLKTAELMETPM